ncbi:hypothetical protein QBC38DRAFT_95021 [Podospora fimiseda]|uniref:Transcription elongation factor Eaf N-terminal domain-containing protein n=1 Tax=Podospora fimiseda TaxID=252190 RepID=A0AAN7C0M0_9PEZI|nr:hypothetical protein QBC38DRAFT_95021 [Podospora fimiseda]
MAALDPTKKYPIILSNDLLGKSSKETFTAVKLNHRPTLSSDATASTTSRIKPSPKDASSFNMSLENPRQGKKYQYNGVRTTDDGKFVLIFDPKRQALVLHRVDSTFHMNLVRTPTENNAEILRKKFPQLTATSSSSSSSSTTTKTTSLANKKQPNPISKLPPKPRTGANNGKVLTFRPKPPKDRKPAPPQRIKTRQSAPKVAIPKSSIKRNGGINGKPPPKPPVSIPKVTVTLPDLTTKSITSTPTPPPPLSRKNKPQQQKPKKQQPQQVSIALPTLPTLPEKKPPPPPKKRQADYEDEDDDDDDDFGLTIEYPDAAPANTTFSTSNTFVSSSLNRRFSELNNEDMMDDEDLEKHFSHFRNEPSTQYDDVDMEEDEEEEEEDEEDIVFEKVDIPEPPKPKSQPQPQPQPQRIVVEEPAVFTFDDGDDSEEDGEMVEEVEMNDAAAAVGGGDFIGDEGDNDLDLEAELEAEFDKVQNEEAEAGGHGSDSEVSEEE